jgi:hypothetical protein
VNRVVKFVENCERSHQFLVYVSSLPDPFDLEIAKKDFGLSDEKVDQAFDVQFGIKDEFIDTQIPGELEKDGERSS